ncbi:MULTISPECIES: NAD-dependent epimerase/dehydratase family protein [unclassified Streptomyces]|uniref:NAD-dependent epimerase/dehydratase family protein n=1 Tax=unclassified Streptomyces TaxID=2593676 RepID=UPI000367A421|nr:MULTISPECIES: NAD-dependent epimerase/dehydratase family protein [unclassified Streptomyces]MYY04512.1 hypothetical protein [Streptomyces sp. SID4913]
MGMAILVIGGGVFIGRHLVQEAVRRGHRVTVLNRGLSTGPLPPGVTWLRGDRADGFDAVRSTRWDTVVDTCAYQPDQVERSARELDCGVYALISTISVYRDFSAPTPETAPTVPARRTGLLDGASYGELKAGCEAALTAARGSGRSLVVRPGLVAGPHDVSSRRRYGNPARPSPTHLHYDRFAGRFPYWPWRFARGGDVVLPGTPDDPFQVLDVRDLAEWTTDLVEDGTTGVFNAVGPQSTWGALARACARRGPGRPVWVPEDSLVAAGVAPHTGLPMWAPTGTGTAWFSRVPAGERPAAKRSLDETVGSVADWLDEAAPDPEQFLGGGEIDMTTERLLLESARTGAATGTGGTR